MTFSPIAIVGRGCVLPGAHTPNELWDVVVHRRDLVTKTPNDRWGVAWEDVLMPPGSVETADRTCSRTGGYVEDFASRWNPEGFGVPTKSLQGLDPMFHWTLHAMREALREAGDERMGLRARARTGAVFGNLGFPTATMNRFAQAVWLGQTPRPPIRNRFMSGGAAALARDAFGLQADVFCLDTACASSLVAIAIACANLQDGRSDLMLAGAVNGADDLFLHIGFTALQALSRSGRSRPFHRDADGLVPAEGAAFVALKRLADARADGNRIFGVIRGVGLSNDGRGRGFLAPSAAGQIRAIRAAYAQAGIHPAQVSLIECHATGTQVGDATEIQSTADVFAQCSNVAIGSLKSNMGHLITAAGAAGLLKVLEAFRHGERPPTLHVEAQTDALRGSPFRVLDQCEPWTSDGPRVAAISAFGFGGNNAHLLVSEDDPSLMCSFARSPITTPQEPLAIVGIGALVGELPNVPQLIQALRNAPSCVKVAAGATVRARCEQLALSLEGLTFPPSDLASALPQQLALLLAAREAVAPVRALVGERVGVFVGMEPDPNVCRFGLRWRAAQRLRNADCDPHAHRLWLEAARDQAVPALTAAAVVGTMPNIPANRLNRQFDFGGASVSVSAGEASGSMALALAMRALQQGELDAALVGAVDFSCNEVHVAAAGETPTPGDAAVAWVLKRLSDAQRDGDTIVATVESSAHGARTDAKFAAHFGHAWAASDLRDLTAAALCVAHGMHPNGESWNNTPRHDRALTAGAGVSFTVRGRDKPRESSAWPRLFAYAASDSASLRSKIEAHAYARTLNKNDGPARLVIVANNGEQLADRRAHALRALSDDQPFPPGVFFQPSPVRGDVAFVFGGAGSAYPNMGHELLADMPSLEHALRQFSPTAANALAMPWREPPSPTTQLWAASAMCQLHAALTREMLEIQPNAMIGYSSGETNALFAAGVWRDFDAMVGDAERSALFSSHLGGTFGVAAKAWNSEGAWETWTVLAPVSEVRALVARYARAYLTVIHSDNDCIVAGHPQDCQAIVAAVGRARCIRLHYDLTVHTPLVHEVQQAWLSLHHRAVHPTPVRMYSSGPGGAYVPSSENCAQAILQQACNTLDFRKVIEAAWNDGVRIFIEHGPQASCARWIRDILGNRPAVVVAIDRKGHAREALAEACAALLAAGVTLNAQTLMPLAHAPPLTLRAHPDAITSLPLPPVATLERPQAMPMAPPLPPIVAGSSPQRTEPTSHPVLAALHNQLQRLRTAELEHQTLQHDVHRAFLSSHRASLNVLRGASGHISQPHALTNMAAPPQRLSLRKIPPPRVPAVAPLTSLRAPTPTGPSFTRDQLRVHASGRISDIFGPAFRAQDNYPRQVRMPEPPLLLADRITGLDATAGSMGKGTIWSESDVVAERWFMHQGRMPAGIMIESGQADLMLISYLGVDAHNRGDRVYRLLGCELTFYGGLPAPGECLAFDIHMDGHAAQGEVRLMFFHSDCRSNGELRLSVRQGQAGFFTDEELAASDGCLWTPQGQELAPNPRLDTPALLPEKPDYSPADVRAFAHAQPWACFGERLAFTRTHTRTPRIPSGRMLLLGDVTQLDPSGGPWGRGYAKSTLNLNPNMWFFTGHFKNDPCMPGTLMFEGCLQLMGFYLTALGFTVKRDGWRFEPVPEQPFRLSCRGQVTPRSHVLTYELFVEELHNGPEPTLYADLLCTIDGLKAFHARRVGLKLAPGWPLDEAQPSSHASLGTPDAPVAPDGFIFDSRSLQACAQGAPSTAFGAMYRRFDGPTGVARLPASPYHFISRIHHLDGEMGSMAPGMRVEVSYDVAPDAWYFTENGARVMPFAVLLEAALQPCGWLASYMGCATTRSEALAFRNLDGNATLHAEVLPDAGALSTTVENTKTSQLGAMIIVAFHVTCFVDATLVYEMDTVFGFFPEQALAQQAGLPANPSQQAIFAAPQQPAIDLRARPASTHQASRPQLAEPMLLMLDRVVFADATGGAAGLGVARAEKTVDPGAWFFKAHFFQDPVQPGSLGIEAMAQLLQWMMLEQGFDAGIPHPHFEPVACGERVAWKYRGQVLPTNNCISTTIEITSVHREANGVVAHAQGSLWVDGKRIYESTLAMRITSRPRLRPPQRVLDPADNPWLADHRPAWTSPVLPMMSMVDMLAQGAAPDAPVVSMRDVRVNGWCEVAAPMQWWTERNGARVRLMRATPTGETEIARADVHTGTYPPPPPAWPPLEGEALALPYASGGLFHGPAFQVMTALVRTHEGASSRLHAASPVPFGTLNPGLLDGATHGIAHEYLQQWHKHAPADTIAYPALVPHMDFFAAPPTSGEVRCEVRPAGDFGSHHLPMFDVQLITDDGVWCTFRLVEACFPKGRLGRALPEARMAFLKDRMFVPDVGLSTALDNTTSRLLARDLADAEWVPGGLATIYGSGAPEVIATKEHIARAHALHPGVLPQALPLHRFDLRTSHMSDHWDVVGSGAGVLDLSRIRTFWRNRLCIGHWPMEDLFLGLVQQFVRRVIVTAPEAFSACQGRSVVYLGNHQVGIESLLFSMVMSAISNVSTVTIAKDEHRGSWLGKLIAHAFAYPGIEDPQLIRFFDRNHAAALPTMLGNLAHEMQAPGCSVMVHAEGTRSRSCAEPVRTLSGTLIELAQRAHAPVVPIKFVGGLPREHVPSRLEFPHGMAAQDIYVGAPLDPDDLSRLPYAERRATVLAAINALGPSSAHEMPHPGNERLQSAVELWQRTHRVSYEHAVLHEVLAQYNAPCDETRMLLAARSVSDVSRAPHGPWLEDVRQWLFGA